jgi:Protein of unknown function, DUF547
MKSLVVFIAVSFFFTNYNSAQTDKFDHSKFDALLKKNVTENGIVNYDAFINNNEFNEYLKEIESADISSLSDEEKLAFYINAYNATVIKNVLDHIPIDSPMDVDGFFNSIKHKIAGMEITLDELEHKYALKIEPVLSHFGLVCAAISCPKLITKAYHGKTVFKQLEENAHEYLNDTQKNKLDRENNILYLSEIFKWFENSFTKKYGSLKNTAIQFMNSDDAKYLKNNDVKIKYMKYNWQLNRQ